MIDYTYLRVEPLRQTHHEKEILYTLINYKIEGQGKVIVLIHGLFGSLGNLGLLARELSKQYCVVSVDLPNHGHSPHSEQFSYESMAHDVVSALTHENVEQWDLIGHSMGGKVSMKIASLYPQQTKRLVVLDMAPVHYTEARHDNVFKGLFLVDTEKPTSRSDAIALLKNHIEIEGVRQFLAKSLFNNGQHFTWRFNLHVLHQYYEEILGWQQLDPVLIPTLFIKGADSEYITADHQSSILSQFPHSKAHVIANTGHWLHAEKPADVLRVIQRFYKK